jgi:hypothetical protein
VLANDPALVIFLVCAVLLVLYLLCVELPDYLRTRHGRRAAGGRQLELPKSKRPQLRVIPGGVRGWR